MSDPIATWLVRNTLGEAVGQRSLYLVGEQPEGFVGNPSDDGRYVLVIEEPPLPPLPEPRPDLTTRELARLVDSPESNLYRAIDAYRTHGAPALPVFWAELERGQRILFGRFVSDMTGEFVVPGSPPPIVRFVRWVVACADGMPLPRRRRGKSKVAEIPTVAEFSQTWGAKKIIAKAIEYRRLSIKCNLEETYAGFDRGYRTAITQKINAVMGPHWEPKLYNEERRFELFITVCVAGTLTMPQQARFVRWL